MVDNSIRSIKKRRRKLESLARERFGKLTSGEVKLLRAVPAGGVADLSPGHSSPPDPNSVVQEQQVRADLLRWVLVDSEPLTMFSKAELWLSGAVVVGTLDLEYAVVPIAMMLSYTSIDGGIVLRDACTQMISLRGCRVGGISADRLITKGNLFLNAGFSSEGEVSLAAAQIGGQLACQNGSFRNISGAAIRADGVRVDSDAIFSQGFSSEGEVRLPGAQVHGQLACENATFRNPIGDALVADRIRVGGGVFFSDGFSSDGQVRLPGAQIGGQVACRGGRFRNTNGFAFIADGMSVDDAVFLSDGFAATGEVRLLGARIRGQLCCSNGKFQNRGGVVACSPKVDPNVMRVWLARRARRTLDDHEA